MIYRQSPVNPAHRGAQVRSTPRTELPNSSSFPAQTNVPKPSLSSAVTNTTQGEHPEPALSSSRATGPAATAEAAFELFWYHLSTFTAPSPICLAKIFFLLTSALRGISFSTSLCLLAQRHPATALPGGFVAK